MLFRSRGLLELDRQPLTDWPGQSQLFERTRYRNLYTLKGAAKIGGGSVRVSPWLTAAPGAERPAGPAT